MGIFKKDPGGVDTAENLVPEVALVFAAEGFPMAEATKMAIQVVEAAKRESRAAGGGKGPGYGDEIIRRAQRRDPGILPTYQAIRAEGVTDDDIRWYWNMPDVEKRVLGKVLDHTYMAHFMHALQEEGRNLTQVDIDQETRAFKEAADRAGARVRRFHPSFGDPADTTHSSGPDRPLYAELKNRIDHYIEKNFAEMKQLHERLQEYSSFNAFVRAEMAAGRL